MSSNVTKKTLRENSKSEDGLTCPFCGELFPFGEGLSENEVTSQFYDHVEQGHQYELAEESEKLSIIALENKSALEEWKEKKKIEILQNSSQTELELYSHSKDALEGRIKDEMWKMAFRQPQRLSTLDTKIMDSLKPESGKCPEGYALVEVEGTKMCIPSHILNEVFQYKAEKRDKEAEYEKTKKQYGEEWNTKEELSETKKKRELMTVLIALLRDKEKKRRSD